MCFVFCLQVIVFPLCLSCYLDTSWNTRSCLHCYLTLEAGSHSSHSPVFTNGLPSCLLQSLLMALETDTFHSLAEILRLSQTFYGYSCSTLLSCGQITQKQCAFSESWKNQIIVLTASFVFQRWCSISSLWSLPSLQIWIPVSVLLVMKWWFLSYILTPRPHGLYNRLLCQWNCQQECWGVGNHSLLQGVFPDRITMQVSALCAHSHLQITLSATIWVCTGV